MVYQERKADGGVVCVTDNCIAVADGKDRGYIASLSHLYGFPVWCMSASYALNKAKDFGTPHYAVPDDFGTLQPVPAPWDSHAS